MQICNWVDRHLDAFRTGELDADTMTAVAEHLASCDECRAKAAGLGMLASRLRQLREAVPSSIMGRTLDRFSDQYGLVETAIGPAWVGFNQRGVTLISLAPGDESEIEDYYRHRLGRRATRSRVPDRFARAVRAVTEGDWTAAVPLDLEGLPAFERAVLDRLCTIPKGEVRPYAWLAAQAGSPRAVRAVGNVMNRNPIPLLLPCHRVVPSVGGVGSYAYGSAIKRTLLEREGVSPDELERLARHGVRYIGSRTTKIYCYPTCRDARRIRDENRVPLANEQAAAGGGFRPCQHCQPLSVAA